MPARLCGVSIRVFSLGPLSPNSYLIWSESTRRAVVIDAGWPQTGIEIARFLYSRGLRLEAILLTHGHFDHVLGAPVLVREASIRGGRRPLVYIGGDDLELASSAREYAISVLGRDPGVEFDESIVSGLLEDLETVVLEGLPQLLPLHTPGHTHGSYTFICCGDRAFTGDTLFKGGIGRTDLPEGSWQRMAVSLRRLSSLSPETRIYPGHGPTSTIGNEVEGNFYVRMALSRPTF